MHTFQFSLFLVLPTLAYAAMMAEYQRRQIVSQFFNHKHQVFSQWKEEINMEDMSHFITSPNAKSFNNNNGDSSSPGDPLGNSFGSSNNRRSRSEDARWECPQCGKRYKYSRGLAMHRRLECGKEPMFHCPYCPQKCHQKGNMVIHIKKKHPEKVNPLHQWCFMWYDHQIKDVYLPRVFCMRMLPWIYLRNHVHSAGLCETKSLLCHQPLDFWLFDRGPNLISPRIY